MVRKPDGACPPAHDGRVTRGITRGRERRHVRRARGPPAADSGCRDRQNDTGERPQNQKRGKCEYGGRTCVRNTGGVLCVHAARQLKSASGGLVGLV